MLSVAAEGGLEIGRVERVQEGAQRVDGRGATKAGAEDCVEPLAMHADEQADAAVGGGAGQDGKDAEQQQGSQGIALALPAARVRDLLQGGEQAGEGHHGGLRCGGTVGSSTAQACRCSLGHTSPHKPLTCRTDQPWLPDPLERWTFAMVTAQQGTITAFLREVRRGPRAYATLAVWNALAPFIRRDTGGGGVGGRGRGGEG